MGLMKILYRDEFFVVVEKASGMHIHPPEDKSIRVHRSKILLYQLRNQLKAKVFPVHRLDVATSGVLVMALSSEIASHLCRQFQNNQVSKKYTAVVRGFVADEGHIDTPLELDTTKNLVPAQTSFQCVARLELDYAVTPKYPKARYSLIRVQPHTGRYHQIRRHFNRISHPVIGDAYHGDSRHNRFFREKIGIGGLCLRANELSFMHPVINERMLFATPSDEKWLKLEKLFLSGQNIN
jgi:tRNA pseudouridine65 synthase